MGATFFARWAGAAGIVAAALLSAALLTLPASTTTGAGFSPPTPTMSVNRVLKGDRLPIAADPDRLDSPVRTLVPTQIPLGCDRAFSPISSPQLAHIFRRCMV